MAGSKLENRLFRWLLLHWCIRASPKELEDLRYLLKRDRWAKEYAGGPNVVRRLHQPEKAPPRELCQCRKSIVVGNLCGDCGKARY